VLALVFALSTAPGIAYSPYVDEEFPRQPLWGDTHLHSSLSTDAFGLGVTLGPDEAFRFASGEAVTSSWGVRAQLSRPLDFVVLADHAESLGMMERVKQGEPALIADPLVRDWYEKLGGTPEQAAQIRRGFLSRKNRKAAFRKLEELASDELVRSIWDEALASADSFNKPGIFTTLLGYEWTSAPGGSNLHRVVVFRDGVERVSQLPPLSSARGDLPEQLWAHLQSYENHTGGSVLAIPHNGNLSNGLMFPTDERYGGGLVDREYAALRARWEPVYEVTQIKGDGETHGLLSPDDEFADYETWDAGNFEGKPKMPEMLPREYARSALRAGLQLDARLGVNPYAFGMLGSTDSHTSLSAVREDNFFGKHSGVEPGAERWRHLVGKAGDRAVKGWEQASSGYAAVWARDNTREALWDAIKRREVYATTGSRMTVRFFGGWDFSSTDADTPDLARTGYRSGVPMGGQLSARGAGATPTFLVAASKDAIGANLDRIQIVKGWLDQGGESREKVYEVVWAGSRKPDRKGKLPALGSTVDLADASWLNSTGAAQLRAVWRDPDFDAGEKAFYYVRVLEIPTPRWTAYDAKRFGIEMTPEVPMVTQERAYTSPIWYSPAVVE
jgi:hypothetical protein